MAKALKRVRIHQKLTDLYREGYIDRMRTNINKEFEYCVTEKGIVWIRRGD